MTNVVKIRKGLAIKLSGKAVKSTYPEIVSKQYAITPDDFHGITPKVVVHAGDKVKAGSELFHDKKRPEIKFVSPISGEVVAINRGAKRKVLNITVQSDGNMESMSYDSLDLQSASKETVKERLLTSGMWGFIKQRMFDIIANPSETPKSIFVSTFDTAPLAPDFEYVLKGQEQDFATGLKVLTKFAPVHLGVNAEAKATALKESKDVTVHTFSGNHPAGNVGVQIAKIDPISKGDIVWTVQPQDVILIGRFFTQNKVDFERIVALTGSEVIKTGYYKVRTGTQLTSLFKGNTTVGKQLRYILGNPLSGTQITADNYLGYYSNQLTVIPEGSENHEFLGWIMPRFKQFSANHSYFSWLTPKKEYKLDARVKGGERAIIMSNEYDKVFPFDIYPEFLLKAIIAQDLDKMEELGIYEVIPEDFALCEFVDTSKLEIQKIVREGLDYMIKELN